MHLINKAINGHPIPSQLTADLIPPSTRGLSDTVTQLKSSLVQDILQKSYTGTHYSPRPQSTGTRERFDNYKGNDWDGIYKAPRFGEVRKVPDWEPGEDLNTDYGGYRSQNRRQGPPAGDRQKKDHWGDLRGTSERYQDDIPTPSGNRGRTHREGGESVAIQELIRRWRKELGEQRILLETASYEAGDSSIAYATEEELRARVQMGYVQDKIRDLEEKISRAERGEGVDWDNERPKERLAIEGPRNYHTSRDTDFKSSSKDAEYRYKESPKPKEHFREPAPRGYEKSSYSDYGSPKESKMEYSSGRTKEYQSYSRPEEVNTEVPIPSETEAEKIKRKASERLSQRMSMLTGKTAHSFDEAPPVPKIPEPVVEAPKPPKEFSTSDLLAKASTKEERQKIIQEEAERRMKEREKFLKQTGGIAPTRELPKPAASPPPPEFSVNNPFGAKPQSERSESYSIKKEVFKPSTSPVPQEITKSTDHEDGMARVRREIEEKEKARELARQARLKAQEEEEIEREREREILIEATKQAREKAKMLMEQKESKSEQKVDSVIPKSGNVKNLASNLMASGIYSSSEPEYQPTTEKKPLETKAETYEVKALYAYQSDSHDELHFKEEEVIIVEKGKTDASGEWWFGHIGNKSGWFPKSYVEEVKAAKSNPTNITSEDKTETTAKVSYDYEAQQSDELSIKAGESLVMLNKIDEHWWTARNAQGQAGIVPSSYLEIHDGNGATRK